jgi:D-amino peptidase
MTKHTRILIIADIEGSSCCPGYRASSFMTREWRAACLGMTQDVNAVVKALFQNGVKKVTVQDFHRTGYNLIPSLMDPRATLRLGYRQGPVPGIGDPPDAEAVMFLGMHAASGSDGFLAHTFTSRIKKLTVNGAVTPEVAFFSAALAPWHVRPVFFSGCPVACLQAKQFIPGINTLAIDKPMAPGQAKLESWRSKLAQAAVKALSNYRTRPYQPNGPFRACVTMRDGVKAAHKLAHRWGYPRSGATLCIESLKFEDLYLQLINLCYLSPLINRMLPLALSLFNLKGRLGLAWVQWMRKREV